MISIIIPTYNEESVLPFCIESLGFQTEESFEIIVVDDGSTDKTLAILNNLKDVLSNFSYYKQNHAGAGAARNLGAKHAKGNTLVFVDADMTFDRDFVLNLTLPIINGTTKGTFSKEEYVNNWDNRWARCWNINEGWEKRRRHPKDFPNQQPVFRAILKSEFDKVSGFTPGGYNDDWSLSKKLGYEAVTAPNAVFYHKNPSTLSETFKQAMWVGKRRYKFGNFGFFIALLRSSFPVSIVLGIYKGHVNKELGFVIFKIVYDFGIFIGVLNYLFSGNASK